MLQQNWFSQGILQWLFSEECILLLLFLFVVLSLELDIWSWDICGGFWCGYLISPLLGRCFVLWWLLPHLASCGPAEWCWLFSLGVILGAHSNWFQTRSSDWNSWFKIQEVLDQCSGGVSDRLSDLRDLILWVSLVGSESESTENSRGRTRGTLEWGKIE